jgi:erythromycin esterase
MNKIALPFGPAAPSDAALVEEFARIARPLRSAEDFDPLLDRIGDARYVLLGEASHGTSEFYLSRASLSRRLIEERGFTFIAVEGDWPDCYRLNRYVRGYPDAGASAAEALRGFRRWPAWMWANWEMVALLEWMRRYNTGRREDEMAGFYGLDVYSLWESLAAILEYLERSDPNAAIAAREAYRCFDPYGEDVEAYAHAAAFAGKSCEAEVIELLTELRRNAPACMAGSREDYFNAEQNALVLHGAEQYYRTMIRGDADSWNIRDRHMAATLDRLMRHHGPNAKAIVWEHNTHIGDARATDMSAAGMVNVGELMREQHGAAGVVLTGYGTYRGAVIAGKHWDAPMQRMVVPPARPGSWEDLLHRVSAADKLLILEEAGSLLHERRGNRAIGVVYEPRKDERRDYVPTRLAQRYDAFIFLEQTRPLHPLHLAPCDRGEPPETYPWGL